MLHTYIARFDVMATVALFGILGLELNAASDPPSSKVVLSLGCGVIIIVMYARVRA